MHSRHIVVICRVSSSVCGCYQRLCFQEMEICLCEYLSLTDRKPVLTFGRQRTEESNILALIELIHRLNLFNLPFVRATTILQQNTASLWERTPWCTSISPIKLLCSKNFIFPLQRLFIPKSCTQPWTKHWREIKGSVWRCWGTWWQISARAAGHVFHSQTWKTPTTLGSNIDITKLVTLLFTIQGWTTV